MKPCPNCEAIGGLSVALSMKIGEFSSLVSLAGEQTKFTGKFGAELSCSSCGWSVDGYLEDTVVENGVFTAGHFVTKRR